MKSPARVIASASILFAMTAGARPVLAQQTIQIPVDDLLNGRAVSTLTGGVVVPWTDGVDQSDGLMTTAAEMFLHQSGVALPDDGVFAADSRHPEVTLHFSNVAAADKRQIFYLHGAGAFDLSVPAGNYTRLFLFLLSSIGASPLTVTLTYADASTTAQTFTLPDWGTGAALPKDPPIFFNLIAGMHKWDKQDQMVDVPSHTITGVELAPAPDKILTKVHVDKKNTGQYLIFWGATGVATNLAGNGGDHDASADGAADGAADVPPAVDATAVVDSAPAAADGAADAAAVVDSAPAAADAGGDVTTGSDGNRSGPGVTTAGCALGDSVARRSAGSCAWPLLLLAAAVLARRRARRRAGT